MMIEIGWVMFASACMALMTAGLATLFPASHRPWWHAQRRVGTMARAAAALAERAAPAVPAGSAAPAAVTLEVVQSVDRRAPPLPFVGKDRRKAGRATARQDHRRHGNGH